MSKTITRISSGRFGKACCCNLHNDNKKSKMVNYKKQRKLKNSLVQILIGRNILRTSSGNICSNCIVICQEYEKKLSISSPEENESFTLTETSKDVELINKNIEEQQLDNSEKNSLTTLQQKTK